MAELDRQTLATYRVLVSVANADGRLEEEERRALTDMLGPHKDLLEHLLQEEVDVERELRQITDVDRRRALYNSAFALAYSDAHAAVEEIQILELIEPNHGEGGILAQIVGETTETLLPGKIMAVADPDRRIEEIQEDTLKYAGLSAVAAAVVPVPGLAIISDIAVVALQAKLVHDIAQYSGHQIDNKQIKAFMTSVAGSTLLRIASSNLMRFIPVWGTAFAATTAFASTYAIGAVAEHFFSRDETPDPETMKSMFSEAMTKGRETFDAEKARIARLRKEHGSKIAELTEKLAAGTITRPEYEQQLAALQ